jgi:hypothetical protein
MTNEDFNFENLVKRSQELLSESLLPSGVGGAWNNRNITEALGSLTCTMMALSITMDQILGELRAIRQSRDLHHDE